MNDQRITKKLLFEQVLNGKIKEAEDLRYLGRNVSKLIVNREILKTELACRKTKLNGEMWGRPEPLKADKHGNKINMVLSCFFSIQC